MKPDRGSALAALILFMVASVMNQHVAAAVYFLAAVIAMRESR